MNLHNLKRVIIVSHVFSPGTSQALRDYFLCKGLEVLFIGHPLFGNVFTWALGVLDTFWKLIRIKRRFDLYVGSNNLNAFIGIWIKRIGKVRRVIYFTPDFSHQRFNNSILNSIWHWLDYFCLKHADLVWNSSSIMSVDLMVQEREKRGVPIKYRDKQISVPDGTDIIKQVPFEDIERYKIGFVGHLKEGMGIEMLIDIFPEIKYQFPEAKLLIIGSGPIEDKLRLRAQSFKEIEFTGFIGELDMVYKQLSKCAIAVAPYKEGTISQYTDPGKVKIYLSLGLPMVITRVPQVALEIEKEQCGIVISYQKDELLQGIVKLLKDEHLLRMYRNNTKRLNKKYRWGKIFNKALSYLKD